jgi:tetratricopeptide (TPR) repeat protein
LLGLALAGPTRASAAGKPAPTPAPGSAPASAPAADAPKEEEATAPETPGGDSAPPEGGTEENAAELAQALEASFLNNYLEAARLAFVATGKIKKGAEKYEGAQFTLAEALEKIGLEQAAAEYYFAVADQRQNPALLARALSHLDALSRKGVLDEDKLLRGVLAEADLASVPAEVADFLHYYRGLSNLRGGYRKWADHDFGAIRSKSYYGRQTALVLAVALIKDGEIDQAVEAIQEILEDDEKDAIPAVLAEARLARARLLYEQGKNEEAITEYQKLRFGTNAAGEALLERAWAHYRSGAYHDSMGLLYALGAPAFRDMFLPDQYILRGLIYQRFCHFRAAKAAVADFRGRYAKTVADLQQGQKPELIEAVAVAAGDSEEVAPAKRVLAAVKAEEAVLKKRHGKLEDGGLSNHLDGLYALLDNRAEHTHKRAMESGARRAAERLLEANEQANLLDYEVGVSIFRPVKSTGASRTAAEAVPSSGEKVYYPFDGEYWTDELPNMRFLIQDRCVE